MYYFLLPLTLQIGTAFVTLVGTWENKSTNKVTGMLLLPATDALTVSSVSMVIGDRILETNVVPAAQGQEYVQSGNGGFEDVKAYNPDVFRLPIPDIGPRDRISVRLTYFETLEYNEGEYKFSIPLNLANQVTDRPIEQVLDIRCVVNTSTPFTKWGLCSHPMIPAATTPEHIEMHADKNAEWDEDDEFWVTYSISSKEIQASLIIEPPIRNSSDTRSSFCLSLAPPLYSGRATNIFAKKVVFVVDKSGSMYGEPFRQAIGAVKKGIKKLRKHDQFNVIMYNHTSDSWKMSAKQASSDNKRDAEQWLDRQTAGGGTNILAALQEAVSSLGGKGRKRGMDFDDEGGAALTTQMVKGARSARRAIDSADTWSTDSDAVADDGGSTMSASMSTDLSTFDSGSTTASYMSDSSSSSSGSSSSDGPIYQALPFIFLITDGRVSNEQEICKWTQGVIPDLGIRVNTFGIGVYCNAFFLRMLATLGGGSSDICWDPNSINDRMSAQIRRAQNPVLSFIELEVKGVSDVELYPFPIPDLFVEGPVNVCGKFRGRFPQVTRLRGRLFNGEMWEMSIQAVSAPHIPIAAVFNKRRLDLMSAKAWLEGSEALRKRVVDLSVETQMPCAHTTMVTYETTPKKKKASETAKRKGGSNKALIAGLAIGSVIVVGAAAAQFGNLDATMNNLPALDGMLQATTDGVAFIGDTIYDAGGALVESLQSGCGCSSDLCCGCFDMDNCSSCTNCCGYDLTQLGIFNGCEDLFGNCWSTTTECFGSISSTCSGFFSTCSSGDCCSPCLAGAKDCCAPVGDFCSGIPDVCSDVCSGIVGCFEGMDCGDICGGDCGGDCGGCAF
eukprot:TRINITY_DN458_c2_g1_i1.p1 TRINITY_DN458_c2_g1~~TRINITY_DN458_c2_g1_i1.p1  ORF type:complete len:841 (-),score=177.26 TRINITY_DN458_c2_g1_i1:1074-3596(-)